MTVPKPLRTADVDLIRVCSPDNCQSHSNCPSDDRGKRPVSRATPDAVRPLRDIDRWVEQGGNYGVLCHRDNDWLIFDVDSDGFRQILKTNLPPTFVVESGGAGVGEHWYYRCSEPVDNNRWSDPEGSLRAKNYHAVGPGCIHAKTGDSYEIIEDREFTTVGPDAVEHLVEKLDREAAGGGGPAAAAPPPASRQDDGDRHSSQNTKKAADLDVEPSAQTLQALGFINSDKRRQDVAKVIDHKQPSRRVRAWAAGFLHSACGLTQNQMERLLQAQADWATDNREIERQVRNMLKKVVRNQRADESVDLDRYLGPDDMTASAVESRKTESGDTSAGLHGGDSKMSSDSSDFDYTSKESVTAYKANSPTEADDGDRVIKAQVTNMNGRDEDGERVDTDFVTVSKGTLRDNGEFGVTPEYPQDNKSVGSADPDDLRLIAQALNEMADEIED